MFQVKSQKEDIPKKWKRRAQKHNEDVGKWVYGDRLYEKNEE